MIQISEEILQKMTDVIVDMIQPEKIILFGSYARGTAKIGSDVDLLIIEKESFGHNRSRRQEMSRIWRKLADFAVPKDILVYSQDEVEYWKDSENHLISRALREG